MISIIVIETKPLPSKAIRTFISIMTQTGSERNWLQTKEENFRSQISFLTTKDWKQNMFQVPQSESDKIKIGDKHQKEETQFF